MERERGGGRREKEDLRTEDLRPVVVADQCSIASQQCCLTSSKRQEERERVW